MEELKIMYTQVYSILMKLDNEKFEKIPKELLKVIVENMDRKYLNQTDELLPEAQALLIAIIEKYFPEDLERFLRNTQ